MRNRLIPAHAYENRCFIAYCNRFGRERRGGHTWHYRGNSMLCGPHGDIILAARPEEALLIAECRMGARDYLLRAMRRHALPFSPAACTGFPSQQRHVFQHPGLAHTWDSADIYLASHATVVCYCTPLPTQGNDGILTV